MAVLRQNNFVGQQRVDVPHIRAIESSVCADFDLLAGSIMAGSSPYVVQGFDLITTGAYNNPATNLQLRVAGGLVLHPTASESGTIFAVSQDAQTEFLNALNSRVVGNFTPSQTNYVGLDLRRSVDDSTSDLSFFLDATTLLETPKTVPLARTLDYRIVISTTDFSATSNILPIAKVTTDINNKVVTDGIVDCRPMLFRLGSGGSLPDAAYVHPWIEGRDEASLSNPFAGGDKSIGDLKSFVNASLTRLWELGGGEYWYSPTSDRDVKVTYGPPLLAENSDNFLWTLGTQTLKWSGVSILFANSTATYNTVDNGQAVLLDGYCLFVDVDRGTNATALTPQVQPLSSLGTPAVPGSRFILAWRRGDQVYLRDKEYEVGREYKYATNAVGSSGLGVVRLAYAAGDLTAPTVLPLTNNGSILNIYASGNSPAFAGMGAGTGSGGEFQGGNSPGNSGVYGVGGASSGHGGKFVGGVPNGIGVEGQGTGTGRGVVGITTGSGDGVYGTSTGGGAGVLGAVNHATSAGVKGIQVGAGPAIYGDNQGSGVGVHGLGAPGVRGSGGPAGGVGVVGVGSGGNAGVTGTGNGAGAGVTGTGGATNGAGVAGVGTAGGPGGNFTGGDTNGTGVTAAGKGTAPGGVFYGGPTDGKGVVGVGDSNGGGGEFFGGDGNGYGVRAETTGSGAAFIADPTGTGRAFVAVRGDIYTPDSCVAKNTAKAFGTIKITHNAAGGVCEVQNGYNISGASADASGVVRIWFTTPLAGTPYTVIPANGAGDFGVYRFHQVITKLAAYVELTVRSTAGTLVDFTSGADIEYIEIVVLYA